MPAGWRLFRVLCFFLLLASGLEGVFSVIRLFYGSSIAALLGLLVYTLQYLFLLMGLSLLNNQYPDSPLNRDQKSRFNLLFVLNFMIISYFFARLLTEYRTTLPLLKEQSSGTFSSINTLLAGYSLYSALFIFLGHLAFLYGMFTLRRVIHTNSLNNTDTPLDAPDA